MNIIVDTAPERYSHLAGIARRCRERLEVMEVDDYLRPNVEVLLELTLEGMEKVAKELPF